jgi:hypothetical protein
MWEVRRADGKLLSVGFVIRLLGSNPSSAISAKVLASVSFPYLQKQQ